MFYCALAQNVVKWYQNSEGESVVGKVCQKVFFVLLAVLAVGQIPTAIGWNFLILAILAAPFPEFQNLLDRLFSRCSVRLFLVLLCLVCIIRQPGEVYGAAGRQMAQLLYGIFAFFNLR